MEDAEVGASRREGSGKSEDWVYGCRERGHKVSGEREEETRGRGWAEASDWLPEENRWKKI